MDPHYVGAFSVDGAVWAATHNVRIYDEVCLVIY